MFKLININHLDVGLNGCRAFKYRNKTKLIEKFKFLSKSVYVEL